jgi:hypothetical protein
VWRLLEPSLPERLRRQSPPLSALPLLPVVVAPKLSLARSSAHFASHQQVRRPIHSNGAPMFTILSKMTDAEGEPHCDIAALPATSPCA